MVKSLSSIIFVLLCAACFAQGNDWIQYNQQYWNVQVAQDEVQVIEAQNLLNSGFPANTSVDEVRVFHRGLEQMVTVNDVDQDGVFNNSDQLILFARKNDGWMDAGLYESAQTNRNYSLFNDTARYYLTQSSFGNPLRTSQYQPVANPQDLPLQNYIWRKNREDYTTQYYFGEQDQNGIALPWYGEAEGWMDSRFGLGQSVTKNISTSNVYQSPGAPDAQVRAISASTSLATGLVNHHLQVGYGNGFNLMVDSVYYGYQLNDFQFDVPNPELSSVLQVTHRSIDDLAVATDFHAVASIEVNYPANASFQLSQEIIEVESQYGLPEEAFFISDFPGNNPACFVMGVGMRLQLPVIPENDGWRVVVPFDFGPRQRVLVVDQSGYNSNVDIFPVNNSGFFEDYAAFEQDSSFLIITSPKLMSAAMQYAAYKESQGSNTLIVNVEELYHQYAAGVWKHPLAIRLFCEELLESWESPPAHLFLVGKSIHEMNISATVGARNSEEHYANNLVPSYGHPTADIPFTAGLAGTAWEPAIPTGRLAAKNTEEVLNYLNKVVEFESVEPAEWMKRILHFGGGGNSFEQNLFRAYLDQYTQIAQDTCFGGEVYPFFKSTLDPIQINVSDSIQLLINEGVSLMTFFGHASSTGFDVNIDSPSSYSNQGKYPLLIGNSCYTGNIHLTNSLSTSENFVLEPNAGTIGFIAKGDLGLPSLLNIWTENFYREIFQRNYGKSIGYCMKTCVEAWQGNQSGLYAENTALTFGLHGDPSLVLNSFELPDLSLEASDVRFNPAEVSTDQSSFEVVAIAKNLGKLTNEGYGVELVRRFPDGTDTSMVVLVEEMENQTEVVFEVPLDPSRGAGLNEFDLFVDYPASQISELEEVDNNIVQGKVLNITSGNLVPVFPFDYAVMPAAPEVLKASTGDAVLEERTYVFQLDTDPNFDSPNFLETTISSEGGVLEWQPNLNWQDETVYYWRTSPDSTTADGYQWRNASFEIFNGKRGFGQADAGQFDKNAMQQLEVNENGDWSFAEANANLKCTVYGSPENSFELLDTRYQINLDVQDYSGCGLAPAIHVAVLDSATFAPWETNYNGLHPENDFGNLMDCSNSRNRTEKYFIFQQSDPSQMQGLVDLLDNQIEDGHHLLVYSWQYVDYDSWEANAPGLF
ncbi:MAG: C25 family cysteine peptidase, partial [Bacteroidota bacterium]